MGWKYFKKLLKAIRFTDTRIVLDVGKEDAYSSYAIRQGAGRSFYNAICNTQVFLQ